MTDAIESTLADFLRARPFATAGAVMTDLDGTAVHEHEGRVRVVPQVEFGLKRLRDLGRPVAVNSLRFPLNVVRTFGRAWTAITSDPLPIVSLNGAITGQIVETASGAVVFEEIDAVPLAAEEVAEVLVGVRGLVAGGVTDLLLFHYPRDWTAGEIIWTADPDQVAPTRAKYASASEVISGSVDALEARLMAAEVCMMFLVLDLPQDRLMAYQHVHPGNFVTHAHVDKLAGARRLADRLGFDLGASVGAGDTPMDSFLCGCGLAVHVGGLDIAHAGEAATLRVADAVGLGEVLQTLATRQERGA